MILNIVYCCYGLSALCVSIWVVVKLIKRRRKLIVNDRGELLNKGEDIPVDEFRYGSGEPENWWGRH